jgi:hypothetical protein
LVGKRRISYGALKHMSYFSDAQAKEIWKAKWKGETVQSSIARFGENTFRFYEVWSEEKNSGTRLEAFNELKLENPILASRTNPAPHVARRRVVAKSMGVSGQIEMSI